MSPSFDGPTVRAMLSVRGTRKSYVNKPKPVGQDHRDYLIERVVNGIDDAPEDGCWEWRGALLKDGYGYLGVAGKKIRVHRITYMLANGDIPEGLGILHSCDNPPCCNPKHLRAGTQADNARDMVDRNRHEYPCGEDSYRVKLKESHVLLILAMIKKGHPLAELAEMFRVSRTHVRYISEGKTWKHITSPAPSPEPSL